MKARIDPSWWALALALGFLGFAASRPSPATHPPSAQSSPALRRQDAPSHATPHPTATPAKPRADASPSRHRNPSRAQEASNNAIRAIRKSGDPAGLRLLELLASSLPPGWEHTFVLHDALVVSGALTDLARLFAVSGLSEHPSRHRRALAGEALRAQEMADDFARRWLARKHPLLSASVIEEILRLPNHEVLPAFDDFNLVEMDDVLRLLGAPVQDDDAPARP